MGERKRQGALGKSDQDGNPGLQTEVMAHKHAYQKKTKHHVLPQSRRPDLAEEESNIVLVSVKEHDLYHQLFQNKLPIEIIDYLVEHFWGGNKNFVENYLDV